MAKEYRIHVHGKQREVIDVDLMAGLVIMLGRQLAKDAREAAEAAQEARAADQHDQGEDPKLGRQAGGAA